MVSEGILYGNSPLANDCPVLVYPLDVHHCDETRLELHGPSEDENNEDFCSFLNV